SLREPLKAVFQLNAETVERHRDELVLANGKYEVDELLGIVLLCKRAPRRIAERRVRIELVNTSQDRRFKSFPTGSVWPLSNSTDFFIIDAVLPSDCYVMPPFVFGL